VVFLPSIRVVLPAVRHFANCASLWIEARSGDMVTVNSARPPWVALRPGRDDHTLDCDGASKRTLADCSPRVLGSPFKATKRLCALSEIIAAIPGRFISVDSSRRNCG